MGATPLTLRCPKCKRYREWNLSRALYDNLSNLNLKPTGRSKTISRTKAGLYDVLSVEVVHDGPPAPHIPGSHCGHVFWTTHRDAVCKVFPDARPVGNADARNYRAK